MSDLATEFDHHSPQYAADPNAIHAALRATCPVAWSERHGGFWALNTYEDVRTVATDPARFSSRHDVPNDGRSFTGITIPESAPFSMPPVEADPPIQREYRRILNPLFSPGAVERLRPVIQDVVDWCIDQHIAAGEIDFVLHLGNPIPALVTMHVMGIDLEGWEAWAEPLHESVAVPPDSPDRAAVDAKVVEVAGRLAATVAARRTAPRSGVINALIDGRIDGRPLADEEISSIVYVLLSAGVDTTTALLSGVFAHLDAHPRMRPAVTASPESVARSCEEYLRYLTPNPTEGRTTTCDTRIGTTPVAAGERVLVNWYAANHDPAAFPEPDVVDLERWPNRHVGFGLGVHRCLGSHLARAIYHVAVPTVLRRLPDYRLDRDAIVRYTDRGMVNGFVQMPGTFTPGAVVGAALPGPIGGDRDG